MPSVSLVLATIIFVSGAAAGSLGALLGIGGGVFFVPLLHLALGFPLRTAAAVSRRRSSRRRVRFRRAARRPINLKLGMVSQSPQSAGRIDRAPVQRDNASAPVRVATVAAVLAGVNRRRCASARGRFDRPRAAAPSYRVNVCRLDCVVRRGKCVAARHRRRRLEGPRSSAWCGIPMRAGADELLAIGVTPQAAPSSISDAAIRSPRRQRARRPVVPG